MSSLIMTNIALVIIRQADSQMPIGHMPGFLSNATKRQAKNGASPAGSMKEVARRLAINASA